MNLRTVILQTLLLCIGAFFSLATSDPNGWQSGRLLDDSWVAANVYEGQTSFPVNAPIELAVGWDDFADEPSTVGRGEAVRFKDDDSDPSQSKQAFARARNVLRSLRLVDANGTPVAFDVGVRRLSSILVPRSPLSENTQYTLHFYRLSLAIQSERPIPDAIRFSTESVAHVTNIWQNNDTVILSFSAPINPASAILAPDSFDFLWEDNEQLYSLASDTNIADYVYKVEGNLLMFTSLNRLAEFPSWLRIGPSFQGLNGEPVTTSGAWNSSGIAENGVVTVPIEWEQLSPCEQRDDVPEPCISFETGALIRATTW